MDPLDKSPAGQARLRNFQNAVYRAIGDENLGTLPPVRAYQRMIENNTFERALEKVQGYSINNINAVHEMSADKPVVLVGFTAHLVGIWGQTLGEDHLPGGSKACELVDKFRVTPEALARALCCRNGRTVCDGEQCVQGDRLGHEIFFPNPNEARAMKMDYQLPLVIGIRQHVYTNRADATDEEVSETAEAVFRASRWNSEEDHGCYAFHLVSEGALSEKMGGPMILAESNTSIRYVTRLCVPLVDPETGCFIMAGKDMVPRQLVQGPTSQVSVRPEPSEWTDSGRERRPDGPPKDVAEKVGFKKPEKVKNEAGSRHTYGHKASIRRHGSNTDPMTVATVFVVDTSENGGSRLMNRHPLEDPAQKRGIWIGATWMARRNRNGKIKSCTVPLPLLYMALGITDDRTLLHYCGFKVAQFPDQREGILKSIETARTMIESIMPEHIMGPRRAWMEDRSIEYDWKEYMRFLPEYARIFFVQSAARLNRHQNFAGDHEAMIHHFYEHIVPRIIDGVDEYDNLVRLATLQNMATRAIRCTSELLRERRTEGYQATYKPPNPNHWGEMNVYGLGKFIEQELIKAVRRAMGNQTREVGKNLHDSGWDTRNIIHPLKFGGASNSVRQWLVTRMQIGRRLIEGLAIPTSDSQLQVMSNTMTLLKEGGNRTPEAVRALHNTAYGLISPTETPEGKQVGKVNKMAIGAVVSPEPLPGTDELIRDILMVMESFTSLHQVEGPAVFPAEDVSGPSGLDVSVISDAYDMMLGPEGEYMSGTTRPAGCEMGFVLSDPEVVKVSWNGIVVGITENPGMLVRDLRQARRSCHALRYMSVTYYHQEIVIQTNFGRLGRWVIVLDDAGKVPLSQDYVRLLLGSWAHFNVFDLERLLCLGVVEFISAMEAESIKIQHGEPVVTPVEIVGSRVMENAEWIEEWKQDETEKLLKCKAEHIEMLFDARNRGLGEEEARVLSKINYIQDSLDHVSSRRPQQIRLNPVLPFRLEHHGRWMCAIKGDTHMDPHPELMLGIAAAVSGFAGFNQSARESIQSHHVTKAPSHGSPGQIEVRSESSTKTRDKVSTDLVETAAGAWAPQPGKVMKFEVVQSESAWLSEDATTEDQATNDLNEMARMNDIKCISRTIDARFPMPANDVHGRLILAFPGQIGEAEKVRAMQQTGDYEPNFGGFMESDDGLFEFLGMDRRPHPCFDKIGADGLPFVGMRVYPGDVVMGLVLVEKSVDLSKDKDDPSHEVYYLEKSIVWKENYSAVVKNVVLAGRPDGRIVVKVYLQDVLKTEEIGNKSSVQAGQKGVISHIHRNGEEYYIMSSDPRYAAVRCSRGYGPSGWSRMTIAKQWSMVLGWLALARREVVRGTFGDCKMTNADLVEIKRLLKEEAGLPFSCAFNFINPATGEPIGTKQYRVNDRGECEHDFKRTPLFCGPIAENKQPQIAKRKCRAMNTGQRDVVTGQPIKGKMGGLRFGEMEVQAAVAHGSSVIVRDRTFWSSDPYHILVCEHCGLPADGTFQQPFCKTCDQQYDIVQVQIPKAAKVLTQEAMAFGIAMRLKTNPTDVDLSLKIENRSSDTDEDPESMVVVSWNNDSDGEW